MKAHGFWSLGILALLNWQNFWNKLWSKKHKWCWVEVSTTLYLLNWFSSRRRSLWEDVSVEDALFTCAALTLLKVNMYKLSFLKCQAWRQEVDKTKFMTIFSWTVQQYDRHFFFSNKIRAWIELSFSSLNYSPLKILPLNLSLRLRSLLTFLKNLCRLTF